MLPAMFFRPALDWEWGMYWRRPLPLEITWSLVVNILHMILEVLCRLSPGEKVNGAAQDIADNVVKLWNQHHPNEDDDGESKEPPELS